MTDDAAEIIGGISTGVSEEIDMAFAFLDDILYARVFDTDRYVFPLPFMLSKGADLTGACLNLSLYTRRYMLPLIISDIPREELSVVTDLFPHVDAWCYEDDDDSFFVRVKNECDMLDLVPELDFSGITLTELRESDNELYAELCRDRELNEYWGYDVDVDNPDGDIDFYLDTARREFDEGIALTLAVRDNDRLVGEATIYDFDYRGSAEIAVRILPSASGRGYGSLATEALIALAREIGLSRLYAEIMEENQASIKMTSKYMQRVNTENGKVKFALSL